MTPRTRSRLALVTVFALFFASFGVAYVMRMSGWEPARTRNFGTLLEPPLDLRTLQPLKADGSTWSWQPLERRWHVVVPAPADCGAPCAELADELHRVWLSEGRKAANIRVLWLGAMPAGAPDYAALVPMADNAELRARLPEAAATDAGIPVYLIDPSGFLVMRYAPGFDPSGLRKDLARLLR